MFSQNFYSALDMICRCDLSLGHATVQKDGFIAGVTCCQLCSDFSMRGREVLETEFVIQGRHLLHP